MYLGTTNLRSSCKIKCISCACVWDSWAEDRRFES